MHYHYLFSAIWLLMATALAVRDLSAGRPVSSWAHTAIICAAVWSAAA